MRTLEQMRDLGSKRKTVVIQELIFLLQEEKKLHLQNASNEKPFVSC